MSSASTTTAGRALIALALAGVAFAAFFLIGRAIGSDDSGKTANLQPDLTAGTEPPKPAMLALARPVPNLIVPTPKRDRRPANSADSAPVVPVEEPAPAVAETPAAPETVVASPPAAPESAPQPDPPQPDPAPQPEPAPTEPPVSFDDSG